MRILVANLDPDIETVLPKYETVGASGIDLIATDIHFNKEFGFVEYSTNLCFDIPQGYEGQLRPRSSISKKPLVLCNSVGTIDSDYRGEVKARFRVLGMGNHTVEDMVMGIKSGNMDSTMKSLTEYALYRPGDKIAQLVFAPVVKADLVRVKTLGTTRRGEGGFGSTGE